VVGHQHSPIWVVLDVIQMDEAVALTDIAVEAHGQA